MRLNKNKLTKWLLTAPAFTLALLGAGCSESGEPQLAESADDISVSFRIMAGSATGTRAVDALGTPAESHIDLANLKILIFDRNETLYDVVYDNGLLQDGSSLTETGRGEYTLKVKLDPTRYNISSEFAIVVLANWQPHAGESRLVTNLKGHKIDSTEIGSLTISDLRAMDFTLNPVTDGEQPESWTPGDSSWIPMFGSRYTSLRGYDSSRFNEANPMPVPDVNLVRAVTKIEVVNLDIENGPAIKSVELVNRNQKGWLMQNYDFTGATSNVTATTLRDNASFTSAVLPFHREGNTFTAYVPEMEFSGSATRRAIRVNLDINEDEEYQKWIYLAPYGADGKPILESTFNSDWDAVKRNYSYHYTINSLIFEFSVDVDPWRWGDKVHIDMEQ